MVEVDYPEKRGEFGQSNITERLLEKEKLKRRFSALRRSCFHFLS
jgi:hypothetical protein